MKLSRRGLFAACAVAVAEHCVGGPVQAATKALEITDEWVTCNQVIEVGDVHVEFEVASIVWTKR